MCEKEESFPYASKKELEEGDKYYETLIVKLPEPKIFSKKKIVWEIAKQLSTKSFFNITIPAVFASPLGMLEVMSLYYTATPSLLEMSTMKSPEDRFLTAVKWAMKNITRMISSEGICHTKPYTPMAGEFYSWKWKNSDGTTTFGIGEKVSKSPPINCFYISNRKNNFSIRSTIASTSKLYTNSFAAQMIGDIKLMLNNLNGEEYELTFPDIMAYGIIWGSRYMEVNGVYKIECKKNEYVCSINFKAKSKNKVTGEIKHKGKVLYYISGYCDKKILIEQLSTRKTSLFTDNTNNANEFFKIQQSCGKLSEQKENHSRRMWHMVTKNLIDGNSENVVKYRGGIEMKERAMIKEMKGKKMELKPKYFELESDKAPVVKKNKGYVSSYKCIYDNKSEYKKDEMDLFENLDMFKKM